jgi:hypothetical protein
LVVRRGAVQQLLCCHLLVLLQAQPAHHLGVALAALLMMMQPVQLRRGGWVTRGGLAGPHRRFKT